MYNHVHTIVLVISCTNHCASHHYIKHSTNHSTNHYINHPTNHYINHSTNLILSQRRQQLGEGHILPTYSTCIKFMHSRSIRHAIHIHTS